MEQDEGKAKQQAAVTIDRDGDRQIKERCTAKNMEVSCFSHCRYNQLDSGEIE